MTYYEALNAEQLEEFYKEWNMTPESLKKDAQYLMDWLQKQPHLPNIKDEKYLMNVIAKCKNRLERTKKLLEISLILKATIPELMVSTDIASKEYEKYVLLGMTTFPLPKLTSEGYRVHVFRMSKNASTYLPDLGLILRTYAAINNSAMLHEQNRGNIFITDFEGVTAAQITQGLTCLRTLNDISKTSARRIIRIYLLNLSPMANTLMTMVKMLSKDKVAERMIIWTDERKDLANELSKDVLPREYGGNLGSVEELKEQFYEHLVTERDSLKEISELRADLSKRPRDSKLCDELLEHSIDGSFRTISIE